MKTTPVPLSVLAGIVVGPGFSDASEKAAVGMTVDSGRAMQQRALQIATDMSRMHYFRSGNAYL